MKDISSVLEKAFVKAYKNVGSMRGVFTGNISEKVKSMKSIGDK